MGDYPYGKPLKEPRERGSPETRRARGTIRQDPDTGEKYFRPDEYEPPRTAAQGEKSKLEFFQMAWIVCMVIAVVIVVGTIGLNYNLLRQGLPGMSDVTVSAISTFGGTVAGAATGSYAILQGSRAWSKNKHVDGPCQLEQTKNGGSYDG